jgi:hypothetical protein
VSERLDRARESEESESGNNQWSNKSRKIIVKAESGSELSGNEGKCLEE